MKDVDKLPKCPRCGEPARYVSAPVVARFVLDQNGALGRIVAYGNTRPQEYQYVCGGLHHWNSDGIEQERPSP